MDLAPRLPKQAHKSGDIVVMKLWAAKSVQDADMAVHDCVAFMNEAVSGAEADPAQLTWFLRGRMGGVGHCVHCIYNDKWMPALADVQGDSQV